MAAETVFLAQANALKTLETGHFADLITVDGDPLADINVAINQVKGVMKGGKVEIEKR